MTIDAMNEEFSVAKRELRRMYRSDRKLRCPDALLAIHSNMMLVMNFESE